MPFSITVRGAMLALFRAGGVAIRCNGITIRGLVFINLEKSV